MTIPKEFPKNSQRIPKKFPQNFENIQFPTSHLESENPFGLVLLHIIALLNMKKIYKNIVNEKHCNLNIEPWTFLVCPQGELTQKNLHNSLFLGGPNKENKPPVLLALILCYLMPEYLHICPNTSITRIE